MTDVPVKERTQLDERTDAERQLRLLEAGRPREADRVVERDVPGAALALRTLHCTLCTPGEPRRCGGSVPVHLPVSSRDEVVLHSAEEADAVRCARSCISLRRFYARMRRSLQYVRTQLRVATALAAADHVRYWQEASGRVSLWQEIFEDWLVGLLARRGKRSLAYAFSPELAAAAHSVAASVGAAALPAAAGGDDGAAAAPHSVAASVSAAAAPAAAGGGDGAAGSVVSVVSATSAADAASHLLGALPADQLQAELTAPSSIAVNRAVVAMAFSEPFSPCPSRAPEGLEADSNTEAWAFSSATFEVRSVPAYMPGAAPRPLLPDAWADVHAPRHDPAGDPDGTAESVYAARAADVHLCCLLEAAPQRKQVRDGSRQGGSDAQGSAAAAVSAGGAAADSGAGAAADSAADAVDDADAVASKEEEQRRYDKMLADSQRA